MRRRLAGIGVALAATALLGACGTPGYYLQAAGGQLEILRLSRPLDDALPIDAYLEALGKYRHLEPEQVAHIEGTVEKNVGFIRSLAEGRHPAMAQAMSGRA